MFFKETRIEIHLSKDMEAAMPTSGPEEMEAIDKHNEAIENATGEFLDGLRQKLEALGYTVKFED